MPTYVAFLRAVNVSPRWVKMQRLRELLSDNGFTGVETHIQSGNVRLTCPTRSAAKVEAQLRELVSAEFGFDIPVVVRTPAELRSLARTVDALPAPLPGEPRVYVAFAEAAPDATGAAALEAWDVDGERAKVVGKDVVIWLSKPANEAKLTNARLERTGRTRATTRDIKVVRTLSEKWGS